MNRPPNTGPRYAGVMGSEIHQRDDDMGNRAMAEIKTEDGSLYFYTHWNGYNLPSLCEQALEVAKDRKGDDAYALRRIVDHLISATGTRDKETGSGLLLSPRAEDSYNGGQPSVVIDLDAWTVETPGR